MSHVTYFEGSTESIEKKKLSLVAFLFERLELVSMFFETRRKRLTRNCKMKVHYSVHIPIT